MSPRTKTREQRLRAAGWTRSRFHGGALRWHRGRRCAGDRYWSLADAALIADAEAVAGRTLWPGDPGWPAGVGR